MSLWQWFWLLALVFWVCLYLPLWGSTEDGGNCVRKEGGQYTFEWLCADEYGTITLAQSDNIKNCYTCFLKRLVIGHGSRKYGKANVKTQSISPAVDNKRVQAKNGQQVCLYKGANDTYTLVVEGNCPNEYRCKYDPNGQPPNIDSVLDSMNKSFK